MLQSSIPSPILNLSASTSFDSVEGSGDTLFSADTLFESEGSNQVVEDHIPTVVNTSLHYNPEIYTPIQVACAVTFCCGKFLID